MNLKKKIYIFKPYPVTSTCNQYNIGEALKVQNVLVNKKAFRIRQNIDSLMSRRRPGDWKAVRITKQEMK